MITIAVMRIPTKNPTLNQKDPGIAMAMKVMMKRMTCMSDLVIMIWITATTIIITSTMSMILMIVIDSQIMVSIVTTLIMVSYQVPKNRIMV